LILLAWHDNETATSFLHRFRKELTRCQHLGVIKSERERVDLFLSLTSNITPTSPYQTRLEILHTYRDARRDTDNELMLADIETTLYAIDEELKINQPSNCHNYQEESALSTEQRRPTSNKTCTYCHKPGHAAFECRTRLRNSPPSSQSSSFRNNTTSNNNRNYQRQQPNNNRNQNSYPPRRNSFPNTRPNSRFPNYNNHSTERPPPKCYNCNAIGHYSSNCPEPRRNNYNNNNNNTQRVMFTDNPDRTRRYSADTKSPSNRNPTRYSSSTSSY